MAKKKYHAPPDSGSAPVTGSGPAAGVAADKKDENAVSGDVRKIAEYLRAGYPALYIVTSEEGRLTDLAIKATNSKKAVPWRWTCTSGLVNLHNGNIKECGDPIECLTLISALPDGAVVLLPDFHQFIEDNNPVTIRKFKDTLINCKSHGRTMIILACRTAIPPELEKDITVFDVAMPDEAQLSGVLDNIVNSTGKAVDATEREALVEAAKGMTTSEAENAYALSFIKENKLDPKSVYSEKAGTVKKNGLMEIVSKTATLDDIGGLEHLKDWLIKRDKCFSQAAREYGLPTPKGMLVIGIPGTGKSLTAKAAATVFKRPLIRLDVGKVFGGLVGQSESNLRNVLKTAEAVAPCILWIDEIEKGFSGTKSSGSTDGGTSQRVFGSFISWMQEKTEPVFVMATANDVSELPPEFLRKGRFDEIFFCDLPTKVERRAIWEIQIKKYKRNPAEFDISLLIDNSKDFTGAEIEQVIVDAMFNSFAKGKPLDNGELLKSLHACVPLSQMMAKQINAIREWSNGKARLASAKEVEEPGNKRVLHMGKAQPF